MGLLAFLVFGALLGMRHAMEVDHLAAVAALATRASAPRQAALQGLSWGLGHAIALFAFGGVVVVVGSAIPESVAVRLELVVAAMLIVLGVDVLLRARRERWHVHVHSHPSPGSGARGRGILRHVHVHSSGAGEDHHASHGHADAPHEHAHTPTSTRRALAIGIMHGLSGSAALVLLALRDSSSRLLSLAYIAVFGLGSMLGMGVLSFAVAVPMRASAQKWLASRRYLDVGAGLGSLAVGAYMAWTLTLGLLHP